MTNGSDDFDYQRERQMEQEAERQRQQRIREKVPGRRVNGKARAGDIDGALVSFSNWTRCSFHQLYWTRFGTNGSL